MLAIRLLALLLRLRLERLTPEERDFGVEVTIERGGRIRRARDGERSWRVDPTWTKAEHREGLLSALSAIVDEMRNHRHGLM